MDVTFKFQLNDTVNMAANDRAGTVIGLMIDRDEIRWAYVQHATADGHIQTLWQRETELSAA